MKASISDSHSPIPPRKHCWALWGSAVSSNDRRYRLCITSIKAFQESIRRSMISGAAPIENLGRTGLAIAEFLSGRSEAVQDMERTLEKARALGDLFSAALLSQALGQSYTQLGEYERAEGYLADALAFAVPGPPRCHVPPSRPSTRSLCHSGLLLICAIRSGLRATLES